MSNQATGSLGALMDQFDLTVDRREGNDESYPYFVDLPLIERCFQPLPHSPCDAWTGDIVIKPLVPGKYWALVAVTDNATQVVTFYYPQ